MSSTRLKASALTGTAPCRVYHELESASRPWRCMRWRSALSEDLALAGHGDDAGGALFRPVKNNVTGELDSPL